MKKRSGDEARFESEILMQKPPLGTPLDWENPLNDGLVMHLAMNEGHGDVVRDLSMNGNHGTLNNFAFPPTTASGWNPGQTGIGLKFDGTNNSIDCGNNPILNPPTRGITVSALVNPTTKANDETIIQKRETTKGYYIILDRSADQKALFIIKIGGVSHHAETNLAIPISSWTSLIGTYDGARVRIYMNGVEQTAGANIVGNIDATSNPLQIGKTHTAALYWDGSIDQPRIHNRALTAKEVKDYAMNPWQVYEQ